jgi:hypothetical protein
VLRIVVLRGVFEDVAVSDRGTLAVREATLETADRKTAWLLASPQSRTWVAYQPNVEHDLPIALKCPAGIVRCERMPFGKIVVRQDVANSVLLEVDATYRPFFGHPAGVTPGNVGRAADFFQKNGDLPTDFVLETATAPTATVNGINYTPRRQKRGGKDVWVVNPYEKPAELRR